MKTYTLIIFCLITGVLSSIRGQETNTYQEITERNAFNLTSELPKPVTLPPVSKILKPNVFLTGITRLKGVRKIHLVLRKSGEPDRFVSLALNENQHNVELKKISKDSALISNNGQQETVSFKNNGLPTIITKTTTPSSKSKSSSRDKKDEKKESKRSTTSTPRANVVKVPSRTPRIDPRIIEKGLEYLSNTDDKEKREYIMKRLESLQDGQRRIKSDQDQNERRRQYDEWRRSRQN